MMIKTPYFFIIVGFEPRYCETTQK